MTGLLTGCRILVVEDEMLVLMNIEMALEDLGCSAITAIGSVTGAISLIAQQSFDAAIIDVNLGGDKSYPVADKLTERGIPFAFSTGNGDHGDRSDLDDRPVLKKPYLTADLVAVLEKLMADKPSSAAT
jgi:CheY-like chemotaxis protein